MNEYSYARVRERVPGKDSTAGLDTTALDRNEYAWVRPLSRLAETPTLRNTFAMTHRRGTFFATLPFLVINQKQQ